MRAIFLTIACLLLASTSTASEWQQVRTASERSDVNVWVKPVEGNPLKAFRGRTEVPHSMLTIMAVLTDVDNFPKWVFQCHSAKLLDDIGDDLAYIYIKGIWPVSDRDAVVRSVVTQDSDGVTTLHSQAASEITYEVANTVRLPMLDNRFILEPLADGWTRITFETFVNPGGMIPAWLANTVATKAPLTTLQKIQKRMSLPRYQLSSKDELKTQLPGIAEMTFPAHPVPSE
jgi:hypothetical protein